MKKLPGSYYGILSSTTHLTPSPSSHFPSKPSPPLPHNFFSSGCAIPLLTKMKFMHINPKNLKLSPKHLFRTKKDRSTVSRSDLSSFSSGNSVSSEGSSHKTGKGAADSTATVSVLPGFSMDWADIPGDVHHELVFKLVDRDGDGMVTRKELQALLSSLGGEPPSEEEVLWMLSEGDGDGHDCISVNALMTRVGSICGQACDALELRQTFEFFDTDRDGKITAEELWKVFRMIGDEGCTLEDCRRMIEGVDKNGDGFVCFHDFQLMMEMQR